MELSEPLSDLGCEPYTVDVEADGDSSGDMSSRKGLAEDAASFEWDEIEEVEPGDARKELRAGSAAGRNCIRSRKS